MDRAAFGAHGIERFLVQLSSNREAGFFVYAEDANGACLANLLRRSVVDTLS